ncbi:b2871f7c-9d46-4b75-afbe-e7958ef4ee83 [Sclerotinia trifoliorum]|uniref:B2871f7c-9d46-4b75-afbe-e7958ef4ee83 n=1 Tax=Sclerotinia trifoliorum TaxID=28548 RepID=A0A8H2ZNA1_9HELO|nr:b2871f7c-9d46-4b75-afbe-e7958ef4ee83 [Sclerotinia trifoliorum]
MDRPSSEDQNSFLTQFIQHHCIIYTVHYKFYPVHHLVFQLLVFEYFHPLLPTTNETSTNINMQNPTSKKAAGSDIKNSRPRQPEKRARAPSNSSSSEPDLNDAALYNDHPLEAQFEARRKYEATLARTPRGYGYDSDTDDTKEFKKTAERVKNMKTPEKTPSSRKGRAKADAPRTKSSRTSTTSSHIQGTPADPTRKEKTPAGSSRSERTPAESNTNTDNVKAMSALKLSNPHNDHSETNRQVQSSGRSGPSGPSSSSTSRPLEPTGTSHPKSHETRVSATQRTHSGSKILPGRHYTLEKYPIDHEDVERRGKTHYVCLVSRRCRELRIDMLRDVEKHLREFHYEALGGLREVAGSSGGKSVGESSKSFGRR